MPRHDTTQLLKLGGALLSLRVATSGGVVLDPSDDTVADIHRDYCVWRDDTVIADAGSRPWLAEIEAHAVGLVTGAERMHLGIVHLIGQACLARVSQRGLQSSCDSWQSFAKARGVRGHIRDPRASAEEQC